jgi:O-antigen ligase
VVATEWSYFEMIRMFGLIGATVIIVLFVFPLYIIYKKRKVLENAIPIFLGYFIYLIVGGTNPLLIGSSGMLVLLVSYSYAYNSHYIRIEKDN